MSDAPEMYVTTTEEIQREVGLLTQAIAARDARLHKLIAARDARLHKLTIALMDMCNDQNVRGINSVAYRNARALLAEEEHMHTRGVD